MSIASPAYKLIYQFILSHTRPIRYGDSELKHYQHIILGFEPKTKYKNKTLFQLYDQLYIVRPQIYINNDSLDISPHIYECGLIEPVD